MQLITPTEVRLMALMTLGLCPAPVLAALAMNRSSVLPQRSSLLNTFGQQPVPCPAALLTSRIQTIPIRCITLRHQHQIVMTTAILSVRRFNNYLLMFQQRKVEYRGKSSSTKTTAEVMEIASTFALQSP